MKAPPSSSGVSIGGLTVLVIFTVLCLTIFSVISLASAQSDKRLSDRNLKQAVRFYAADGKAEERLRKVDQLLAEASAEGGGEAGFWRKASVALGDGFDAAAKQYAYEIPVSDVLSLRVVLKLSWNGGPEWAVQEWNVYSTLDYVIDESIDVWGGE